MCAIFLGQIDSTVSRLVLFFFLKKGGVCEKMTKRRQGVDPETEQIVNSVPWYKRTGCWLGTPSTMQSYNPFRGGNKDNSVLRST